MQYHMFSVYDKKARCFCKPFSSENEQTATRAFVYAANDPTSDIGRYPTDFALYYLGTFEDSTGICTFTEPVYLLDALSIPKQEVEQDGL